MLNFPLEITFTKSAGSRPAHSTYNLVFKNAVGTELGNITQLFKDDAPVHHMTGYIRERFTSSYSIRIVADFWIRLNDTTDNLNIQNAINAINLQLSATGSLAVVAGDFIEIKVTYPSPWGTPATNIGFAATILIE